MSRFRAQRGAKNRHVRHCWVQPLGPNDALGLGRGGPGKQGKELRSLGPNLGNRHIAETAGESLQKNKYHNEDLLDSSANFSSSQELFMYFLLR